MAEKEDGWVLTDLKIDDVVGAECETTVVLQLNEIHEYSSTFEVVVGLELPLLGELLDPMSLLRPSLALRPLTLRLCLGPGSLRIARLTLRESFYVPFLTIRLLILLLLVSL